MSFHKFSSRNGGAHGRYGIGDWSFLQCREHMTNVCLFNVYQTLFLIRYYIGK